MNAPTHDPLAVYDTCVNSVGDPGLRKTYAENRSLMGDLVDSFNKATISTSWANLPRVGPGNPTATIVGALTKEKLIALYDRHMVAKKGPPRNIYDNIIVANGAQCPFCGGIGQVGTLDHYLPKCLTEN